jgi:peptidyl-prolyl cis-trans isomerase D
VIEGRTIPRWRRWRPRAPSSFPDTHDGRARGRIGRRDGESWHGPRNRRAVFEANTSMLQVIREKKFGLFVKILLGIIVIGFSFFGIESYFVTRSDAGVAKVDGVEITQEAYRERFDNFRQMVNQRYGGALGNDYFEKAETKRQVLDQLVNEQVLLAASEKLGIAITNDRVREEIAAVPAFQTDGKFDPAAYRIYLSNVGRSAQSFESRIRQDLALRELPQQLAASAFVTDAEVGEYVRLRDQTRDFRYVKIARPEPADANVTDDQIQAYYKEHGEDYKTPEQVSLEYLELDAAKIAYDDKPSDDTLRERYEKEKARFVSEEQRKASHILVKVPGKGSPDDQRTALAKAQDIEKQIRDGKPFVDLAKEYSDDLGSKNQGGDLGWLDRGTTDEAFESALFALAKGEVSEPVLSSEGYHIIRLDDLRPGTTRTFEEVRPELAREYAESERERLYGEKSGKLVDLAYEDPSSLEPAAKALGLTVQKTPPFARAGGNGIAANPAVVKAAFSDSVLVQRNNSDAIDLGPNHMVVIRVGEHLPSTPKKLDEVRDAIRKTIIAGRVREAAKKQADEWFAALQKNPDLTALAAAHQLSVEEQHDIGRRAVNVDRALVQAVFEMPRPGGDRPVSRLVPLGEDTYALVQLEKVTDPDVSRLDAKTREAARNNLVQARGDQVSRDFIEALRKGSKVELAEQRLP